MTRTLTFIKKALPASRFGRDVLLLGGSAFSGRLVVLLASPVLTRLFSPSDFGILAVFSALVAIIAVLGTGSYELSIPIPSDDRTAASLLLVTLISIGFTASVLFLVTVAWSLGRGTTGGIVPYLWLVPLGLLGEGLFRGLSFWMQRGREITRIAQANLFIGGGEATTQVAFGFAGVAPMGLLVGDIVKRFCGSAPMAWSVWKRDRPRFAGIRGRDLLRAASRYRRFPLIASWASASNTMGLQMMPLLLTFLYSGDEVGWFALAQRVMVVPITFVGRAVSQVFVGDAVGLIHTDLPAFENLVRQTLKRLLWWSILPAGIIALGGGWLFPIVFGGSWIEAGQYSRLLSIMFVGQMTVMPVSMTLNLLEFQHWQFFWDAGRVASGLLVVMTTAHLGLGARWAVLAYSLCMAGWYVLFVGLCFRAIRIRKESPLSC